MLFSSFFSFLFSLQPNSFLIGDIYNGRDIHTVVLSDIKDNINDIQSPIIQTTKVAAHVDQGVVDLSQDWWGWSHPTSYRILAEYDGRSGQYGTYHDGHSLVIRKSRLFDFSTLTTAPFQLFLRYLACQPVGYTGKFPADLDAERLGITNNLLKNKSSLLGSQTPNATPSPRVEWNINIASSLLPLRPPPPPLSSSSANPRRHEQYEQRDLSQM